MELIFSPDDSGTKRATGHATATYSSDAENETVVETTQGELASIFENSGVDNLAGTDEPVEAAVDDPLAYRDFLILDAGEIVFDEIHERPSERTA